VDLRAAAHLDGKPLTQYELIVRELGATVIEEFPHQ
jgi:hypothetical protein